MKPFITLIRREFWENRGGFLWTPFIVVGAFLLFTLMGILTGESHVEGPGFSINKVPMAQYLNSMSPETMLEVAKGLNLGLASMALVVQGVLGIVLFFYLISALFDDRRDRSILFWKSMPISDLETVGSKVFTAAFVAPLIAWVAVIVFHLISMLTIGVWMTIHGVNVFELLSTPMVAEHFNPIDMWLCMLAAIPVNALWAFPTYGWLLLVSSWARSKPLIWAVAVPMVSGALLSWADMLTNLRIPESWMWFHVIPRGLASVLPFSWGQGGSGLGYHFSKEHTPTDVITLNSIFEVLGSANLWLGVLAGAALIAAAIYLRRYREMAD